MTDKELRDRAAEASARSFGEQLRNVLKAVFLAGAEWERDAIIRGLEEKDGRPADVGSSNPTAVDPSPIVESGLPATRSASTPRRTRAKPRPVGAKRPSASEEALAVIADAGTSGIGTPEILEKLRGDAPQGGQRDNTVSKALRRLRRDKKVDFDGSLYRPVSA